MSGGHHTKEQAQRMLVGSGHWADEDLENTSVGKWTAQNYHLQYRFNAEDELALDDSRELKPQASYTLLDDAGLISIPLLQVLSATKAAEGATCNSFEQHYTREASRLHDELLKTEHCQIKSIDLEDAKHRGHSGQLISTPALTFMTSSASAMSSPPLSFLGSGSAYDDTDNLMVHLPA